MKGKDSRIRMNNAAQSGETRRTRWIQIALLLLALLTSPALCCSGLQVLDALPSRWLPGPVDFIVNLFETEAWLENHTCETLYLTAITTTYGDPRVIPQNIAFRQRNIPVESEGAVALQYDSADLPLAGIAVCRREDDCRLLPANGSGIYELNSYDSLESLDPVWLKAINSQPVYNFPSLIIIVLSVVCLLLFSSWLYLNWRERQRAG